VTKEASVLSLLLVAAWPSLIGLAPASAVSARESEPRRGPEACVKWMKSVTFRNYGYDHWVHLVSRCNHRVRCSLRTDVNPGPIVVDLEPKEERSVLTFLGSPASVFEAQVSCERVTQ
jgi:hypothetical protein